MKRDEELRSSRMRKVGKQESLSHIIYLFYFHCSVVLFCRYCVSSEPWVLFYFWKCQINKTDRHTADFNDCICDWRQHVESYGEYLKNSCHVWVGRETKWSLKNTNKISTTLGSNKFIPAHQVSLCFLSGFLLNPIELMCVREIKKSAYFPCTCPKFSVFVK